LDQGGIPILAHFRRIHDPGRGISIGAATTGFSYGLHFIRLLSAAGMITADANHYGHDDKDDP
jgi:hypothetical protein